MDILYEDARIVVAVKPAGVLSTDEPGGHAGAAPRPAAHRLHPYRSPAGRTGIRRHGLWPAAARPRPCCPGQLRDHRFTKEYLAVLRGAPSRPAAELTDLLARDPQRRLTYVASAPSPDTREARLSYGTVDTADGLTLVRVRLYTGRTHQIRVQFASRGLPLSGDRKYGADDAPWPIALWSYRLSFDHPQTGAALTFSCPPPQTEPWTRFTLPDTL